jgi:hypothetical protein
MLLMLDIEERSESSGLDVTGCRGEGLDGHVLQVFGKSGTFERTVNIVQFIEQSGTEWEARHEHEQHDDEHEVLVGGSEMPTGQNRHCHVRGGVLKLCRRTAA